MKKINEKEFDELRERMTIEVFCIESCSMMIPYDIAKRTALSIIHLEKQGLLKDSDCTDNWRNIRHWMIGALLALETLDYELIKPVPEPEKKEETLRLNMMLLKLRFLYFAFQFLPFGLNNRSLLFHNFKPLLKQIREERKLVEPTTRNEVRRDITREQRNIQKKVGEVYRLAEAIKSHQVKVDRLKAKAFMIDEVSEYQVGVSDEESYYQKLAFNILQLRNLNSRERMNNGKI